ncbi:AAA family ATPase [Candidatus Poribacteria bacterium]|nr:AAA family ATPase [Candidatus Poribacteria bacterium]
MPSNAHRLQPRRSFLEASRRIRLYFVTGSPAKLAQAMFVFNRLGLPLSGSHPSEGSGIEDYLGGARRLVVQKLSDVPLGSHSIYFVEDTYVRIEALSGPVEEANHSAAWAQATEPGLKTKEWFRDATFEQLNQQIRSSGGDRRATVYSIIGLNVPGVDTAQIFSASTTGTIADRPGRGLKTNRTFPWLAANSFNAWFVPDGADSTLSDLELEQSLEFDFRVSALLELADRIEEYVAVLNISPVSVELVPRRAQGAQQMPLFSTRPAPVMIIGPTCAGKTTLGQLLRNYGYEHIEASAILKILQSSGTSPNSRPGYFQAMATLSSEGWDVIAKRAVELYSDKIETGICITGLRTIEEILYLANTFPDMLVVLLESPEETRFQRYTHRNREGDEISLARFKEREQEHASFGLMGVAEHCATLRISNNSTLEDLDTLASLLSHTGSALAGPSVTRRGIGASAALRSQIYRCLVALTNSSQALSPSQIERHQIRLGEFPIVKRNAVRKVVAEFPNLIRRVSETDGTAFYSVTEHGRAYVDLIEQMTAKSNYQDTDELLGPAAEA